MTNWILERRTKRSEFEYQESSSGRKPSLRDVTRPATRFEGFSGVFSCFTFCEYDTG